MIGVVSKPAEKEVIEEFFQLFKTPWEFYNPLHQHQYAVLLVAGETPPESDASLIVIYASEKLPSDACDVAKQGLPETDAFAVWGNIQMPIYGRSVTFFNPDGAGFLLSNSADILGFEKRNNSQRILRIGYDLFQEVSFLLTKGQPPKNAVIPTLDFHIAVLRCFITEYGIRLVEIPPVPAGYKFIACLTHDVDFIAIRRHFIDHSFLGFLYRATVGSVMDYFRDKTSLQNLKENLKAVFSLPLIFMKLCRDPWNQFDRYIEIEQGSPSTFFFIPFKNQPGEGFHEKRQKYRACKYDVDDVKDTIKMLLSHGCEVGVHGLDSWHSAEMGRQELNRIRQVTTDKIGIRMHWLCTNEHTFRLLDQAGYDYDSTSGYNESIGFRAGTSQVYKPMGAEHLLELPMHIQDTALFSPGRMDMSKDHAEQLCDKIIDHVVRQMGVITLLWHQRSIGPERLWGDFYSLLIKKLRGANCWFTTAQDAVDWFRIRRSVSFTPNEEVHISYHHTKNSAFPPLVLRTYQKPLEFCDKPIEICT
ncbi:MAG: hypothetical protein WCJ37_00155 [Syntrophus sp. (in: bacteria)]